MRWSSIKSFIWDSLPYQFHHRDIHTDNPMGGVLKRFLDVCSEYFDEEIRKDIDDFSNIWDIDTTSPIFLNYLWEYLGYIPYAYGIITTGKPFSKDDLEAIPSNYVRVDNCPLPEVDYRRLLKYAISLYKIRCTKQFYTILGKFYGIEIVVNDPTENDNPFVDTLGLSGVSPWELHYDLSNMSYDDSGSLYDKSELCNTCDTLEATITIPVALYNRLMTRGTLEYAKRMILEILNKYLPIQVRPFEYSEYSLFYTTALYQNSVAVYGSTNTKSVYPSYQKEAASIVKFIIS